VVGRPPQEDSSFGWLIHELVEPLTGGEFPGIREIHAVDAAGVHPLLLAIGSERYMPFRERKPEEILTQANHLLGKGQTSLAKFLIISAEEPGLDTHDIPGFFNHVLERLDFTRDLHFQTKTTIDTLDYSGTGWNEGSKVVIACCGEKRRNLLAELPENFTLPDGFSTPRFVQPGILAIAAPHFLAESGYGDAQIFIHFMERFSDLFEKHVPLILLVDDPNFVSQTLNNFLWVTFTRANPSHDLYGLGEFVKNKHWGCRVLVIDARKKPHHAPELEADEMIHQKIKDLLMKGGEF
jgi:4-hydroxy-3-polyprenylbenzoate decarboxylase